MTKQKTKYTLKCECGKEIVGFSEHHAKVNLEMHKKTSQYHKEVMKVLKRVGKEK